MKYLQGKFKPRNPKKYKGDPTKIVFRSSWEQTFFNFCDMSEGIEWWSSEELAIPYRSPLDGKLHRYFPDVILKTKKETLMVEIKPKAQTRPPVKKSRVTRRYINEVATWGVNEAKWKAAIDFCKDRKWKFKFITEDDLNLSK